MLKSNLKCETHVLTRVVLQVLNWRVVDSDLAIGLCTILSKAAVVDILWKMINSAWQNYDKIKVRLKFVLAGVLSRFLQRLICYPAYCLTLFTFLVILILAS